MHSRLVVGDVAAVRGVVALRVLGPDPACGSKDRSVQVKTDAELRYPHPLQLAVHVHAGICTRMSRSSHERTTRVCNNSVPEMLSGRCSSSPVRLGAHGRPKSPWRHPVVACVAGGRPGGVVEVGRHPAVRRAGIVESLSQHISFGESDK